MNDINIGDLPSAKDDRVSFFVELLKTHGYLFKDLSIEHNEQPIPNFTNDELSTLFDQAQSIVDISTEYGQQSNTDSNISSNIVTDIPKKPPDPLRRSTRTRQPAYTLHQPTTSTNTTTINKTASSSHTSNVATSKKTTSSLKVATST